MSTAMITDERIAEAYRAGCGLSFGPNAMQREMYRRITGNNDTGGCAVLLKSPTGSGKMEAVVVPAIDAERRLFMIYPARSLLQDQEERIARILQYRSGLNPDRAHSLVVDTGAERYRRVWIGGDEQRPHSRERRHLLHGDVILTTLDKFLYRFFGFGEERKGYIYPLRMRYGRRPLFCFDEAHSYDDVAFGNFVDLVRSIGFNAETPRDVIVMTATMPTPYEKELTEMLDPLDFLEEDQAAPPRAFSWRGVTSNYRGDEQREAFLQRVMETVKDYHTNVRRTIVALERVRDAIDVYQRLTHGGWPHVVLYHGHQTQRQRREMYKRLAQQESYLLVTTSAIEVGCDLDAHTLITEICNPDQLIQRAGRCNRRRSMGDACIVVIGDMLLEDRRTVHISNLAEYFDMLHEMERKQSFTPGVLLKLGHRPHISDYRVRTMFSMLYEYVYEAERANKPLHDKGLVVTRSWEPVITLATAWNEEAEQPENALEVGIESCIASSPDKLTPGCRLYVRHYDEKEQRWKRSEPAYGGSAYSADIVVVAPARHFDETLGYHTIPRIFIGAQHNGYERRVIYAPSDLGAPGSDRSQAGKIGENKVSATSLSENPTAGEKQRKVIWRYLASLPRADDSEVSLDAEVSPSEIEDGESDASEADGEEDESDE